MKREATLVIAITYDDDITDAGSVADAVDQLLETSMSTMDILSDYGNPYIGPAMVSEFPEEDTPVREESKYKVNGIPIAAKQFAYDGCHKIYLLNTPGDVQDATETGYGVLPISELQESYENSCGLKFIQTWSTFIDVARQCEEATFEGFSNAN